MLRPQEVCDYAAGTACANPSDFAGYRVVGCRGAGANIELVWPLLMCSD